MDISDRRPALSDLYAPARRRIPRIAWEYRNSGVGEEEALIRNRRALGAITFTPRFPGGAAAPDISSTLFGTARKMPVGMSSLIWPGRR